jgi:transposase-like protein
MANAQIYRDFRYRRKTINCVVCFYLRFSLSFRDIGVLSRGVIVTCATIPQWTMWFQQWSMRDANQRRSKPCSRPRNP